MELTCSPTEVAALFVLSVKPAVQAEALGRLVEIALTLGEAEGFIGQLVGRGHGARDVFLYTRWASVDAARRAFASPEARERGAALRRIAVPVHGSLADGPTDADLYRTVLVDRADGATSSTLGHHDRFHFINVYSVAEGRADDFQAFFSGSAPVTREQPGYVSANVHRSLDGRRFFNLGQYETEASYWAIFRRPRVLLSWAGFFTRGLAEKSGFVPRRPRIRTYEIVPSVSS